MNIKQNIFSQYLLQHYVGRNLVNGLYNLDKLYYKINKQASTIKKIGII